MVKLTALVGEKYILEILSALSTEALRFSDMENACSSEKTRTIRLKELVAANLIETCTKKKKGRFFVHYTLTARGKKTLELAKVLNEL